MPFSSSNDSVFNLPSIPMEEKIEQGKQVRERLLNDLEKGSELRTLGEWLNRVIFCLEYPVIIESGEIAQAVTVEDIRLIDVNGFRFVEHPSDHAFAIMHEEHAEVSPLDLVNAEQIALFVVTPPAEPYNKERYTWTTVDRWI